MPNWCNNSITIKGPANTVRQLWESAHSSEDHGLLQAMAPMPQHLEGTTSPSQTGEDWYTWRVNNWGTKWDISDEGLDFEDQGDGTAEITGWFDSAWAPPIGAYEQFLEENEDCTIAASYYEPGMDFAGFYTDGEDEYLEDLHAEYKLPEDQQSDLFKRLDEEYDLSSQFADYDEEYESEDI